MSLKGHIEEKRDKKGNIRAYKAVIETGSGKKRKRRTKTFSISEELPKREAKEKADLWLAKMKVEKAEGKYIEKDMLTVETYMLDWLENEKKPHIATTTYDNYLNRLKTYIIPNIGHIPIQKLEPYHISQLFASLRRNGRIRGKGGLSENTLKKIYVLLNSAMKKAVRWRLIPYNIVQAVDSPQPENYEALAMTAEDVRILLEVTKDDILMYTFILFAVLTGMRKSEILGLKWDCIELGKKAVKVKQRLVVSQNTDEKIKHEMKTKRASSKRTIIIPDNLVFQLKRYKNYQEEMMEIFEAEDRSEDNYVFSRPDGFPYYPTSYNDKFNTLLEKAGLNKEYNINTLRHTFGTQNKKSGTDAKIIQVMMGHSNISTTLDIYTHVDFEMQEEAARTLERTILGDEKEKNNNLGTYSALAGSNE